MKKIYLFFLLLISYSIINAQSHFSATPTQGCGTTTVAFSNLHPSLGVFPGMTTTGFKYQWNFGNGQTSAIENPAVVTYTPGTYNVTYKCTIDTVGFTLTNIDISAVGCSDVAIIDGAVDIFIEILDGNGDMVCSVPYTNDVNPPVSFPVLVPMKNPPYYIRVIDYDSSSGNDNCLDGGSSLTAGTFLNNLPPNDTTGFGTNIIIYNNLQLTFSATFEKTVVTYTGNTTITIYPIPAAPVVNIPVGSYCNGQSIPNLVATGSSIKWYSDSLLTNLVFSGNSMPVTLPQNGTYHYYATQTDALHGCVSSFAVATITIGTMPPPVLLTDETNFCTGEVLPKIIASGNIGATIKWYTDSLLTHLVHTGDTLAISNTAPGNYTYYLTQNTSGCASNYVTYEYTLNPGIHISFDTVPLLCNGNQNGAFTAHITNGTSPYTIMWSTGTTGSAITGLGSGEYVVTVIDVEYCLKVASVVLISPAEITIDETIEDVQCGGAGNGSIAIEVTGGTTPYIYTWSNSRNTATIQNLLPGNYSVVVTDAHACSETASYEITEPIPMVVTHSVIKENCNGSNDGKISLTTSGGIAPYTYKWSQGAATENIEKLHTGTYTYTVTDFNNCTIDSTLNLQSIYDRCIDIATVLTPNADGYNDTWKIKFIDMYADAEVFVFDKTGLEVFSSKGYSAEWDGTNKGKELQVGSYFFIIDLKDNSEPLKGTVSIIR